MPQAAGPLRAEDQPTGRPDLRLVEGERRTITITGHPTPAARAVSARRSRRSGRRSPAQQQIAARPDRGALWAFLLGVFLVFMAVATAHAAV
jgi:uncharacterized membrane protein YbhN (UPF0104 family)